MKVLAVAWRVLTSSCANKVKLRRNATNAEKTFFIIQIKNKERLFQRPCCKITNISAAAGQIRWVSRPSRNFGSNHVLFAYLAPLRERNVQICKCADVQMNSFADSTLLCALCVRRFSFNLKGNLVFVVKLNLHICKSAHLHILKCLVILI